MSICLLSSEILNPAILIFLPQFRRNLFGLQVGILIPDFPELQQALVLPRVLEPPDDFSKEFLSSILRASKTFCQTQSFLGYSASSIEHVPGIKFNHREI